MAKTSGIVSILPETMQHSVNLRVNVQYRYRGHLYGVRVVCFPDGGGVVGMNFNNGVKPPQEVIDALEVLFSV